MVSVPPKEEPLPDKIKVDWEIHRIANAEEVRASAAEKRDFRVGLILLNNGDNGGCDFQTQLYPLLETPIQWIALVPPDLIRRGSIRALISEYCFDYHTLPFDTERLLATLGHA